MINQILPCIGPMNHRHDKRDIYVKSFVISLLLGFGPLGVFSKKQDQVSILVKFYHYTDGVSWRKNENWLEEKISVCEWHGVSCYNDDEVKLDPSKKGMIKGLELQDNRISGTPPPELFDLPYLKKLDLKDNPDLDFSFDGIEEATQLEELALSSTGIQSLDGIEKTSKTLQELHLTDNGIKGPIPEEIYDFTNLKALYCNYNRFTGTLSTKIGNLVNLEELLLYDNELGSQIPETIGNLDKLNMLVLAENKFTGTLPETLNNMTALEVIAIQYENGKGGGIGGTLPDLSKLENLREFYASGNSLTGSIPESFLHGITNTEGKIKIDLSENKISGIVPESLSRFERMILYLEGNEIEGVSNNLCEKDGWMNGDVESFKCDAILCPPGQFQDKGRQSLEDSPCEICPHHTESLFFGATKCYPISSQNVSQVEILETFFHEMSGRFWKRQDGWLSEDVSLCNWYGITCKPDGYVKEINLSSNGLRGSASSGIFTIPSLESLDLSNNPIELSFAEIDEAKELTKLTLSSTDLKTIRGIAKAPSLKKLNIENNPLSGNIEAEIFDLTKLKELILSHNTFTGPLPSEIGKLINLEVLRCYGCGFSGQLPATLGNLVGLNELDLAENDFTGILPQELGELVNLKILSLHQTTKSGPGIGGRLLDFAKLRSLTELYLDSNSLTGDLPLTFLQDSTVLSDRIYIGLSSNNITGEIPSEFERFEKLDIDLTDNMIEGIKSNLCKMKDWMGGKVDSYGCDAILCKRGSSTEFGRETDVANRCKPCPPKRETPFYGSTECNEKDNEDEVVDVRSILEKFYFATDGRQWDIDDNWLDESISVCEWYGITCYEGRGMDNNIESIMLKKNRLSGTMPKEIFQLPHLRVLNLKGNSISVGFEGIEEAVELEEINLSDTGLYSMEGISKAKALRSLHLTNNELSSHIPEELYDLVNIEELYLNYNKLSGRLSTKLANLKNIREIFLYHNLLSGQIPPSIGQLKHLEILVLGQNHFGGTLPEELNNLTNLKIFSIEGYPEETKEGVTGPVLEFDRLPELEEMYLGFNRLTGTLPSTFLNGVIDKSINIKVDLCSNQLEGPLPNHLASFEKARFYVAGNKINSIPSELCQKNEWMDKSVNLFECDAIACPPGTYNDFGRQIEEDRPCRRCEDDSIAPFYGSTSCISRSSYDGLNERSILEEIFHATNGPGWKISVNWLNPDVSICRWYGITCRSDEVESVQEIHLRGNLLSGQFPRSVFSLPSLREVNLAGNTVEFNFDGIANAKRLTYLNLDETGLTSLAGIENAVQLRYFHATSNELEGEFPEELLGLTNLKAIDLSDNSFSGGIPSEMKNLVNLRMFQCSGCGLSGTIPEWIGDLSELSIVRLDENRLTGVIPKSLENLQNLEELDLSFQTSKGGEGITGPLLDFSNLQSLRELILQGNSLTGTVPSTLLTKVDGSNIIADLRGNKLKGKIPIELSKLWNIVLLLSDNMIEEIPEALCNSASSWMNGEVASFGCNGILCPPGTYELYGRQSVPEHPCQPCQSALYYGSTRCKQVDDVENVNSSGDGHGIVGDRQRAILAKLYREMGGDNWIDNTNWLHEAVGVCQWFGVTCGDFNDGEDQIVKIKLSHNRIHSTPPREIFELPYLEELDLKGNLIQFSFDGIERAERLKKLVLSETGLTSIVGVGKASALTSLHLTQNDLTGTIPDETFDLLDLKELLLNYNSFTGTLSEKIGNLINLEELFLFHNDLHGPIPSAIGNLRKLKELTLAENHFSGTLPLELNNLVNIEILAITRETPLSNNAVEAGITGPLLNFSNFENLKEMYLAANRLSGSIPESFLNGIVDKSKSLTIDLTVNNLEGSIPASLATFENMRLFLAGNNIVDIPNEICDKKSWMRNEVKSYGCDAILCPPQTYNEYGRQSAKKSPCQSCENPIEAPFYGSLECTVGGPAERLNERRILSKLFEATDGINWIDSTGWMDNNISVCEWHGIECLASKDDENNNYSNEEGDSSTPSRGLEIEERVTRIRLGANRLRGMIPSEIFFLPSLQVLDLHGNDIDIRFEAINMATKLDELNLDATKVRSLTGIEKSSPILSSLHIEKNDFGGNAIDEGIFELVGLKYLFMSESTFSGSLPVRIGNLVNLRELYCSHSNLSGELPTTLGELTKLTVLDLSYNKFTGSLPIQIGFLPNLKSLSIHSSATRGQGIKGPLPDFSNLPYLVNIDLSFNSLTGSIPPTFLKGIADPIQLITIDINSNALTGTIPSELSRLRRVNIDVTSNLIEGIAENICSMSEWMQGIVGTLGCDAILCPPGTFNARHGRMPAAALEGDICESCDLFVPPFYGQKECGSVERIKERAILTKFYEMCNGDGWRRKDNWLSRDIDVCSWYGISCNQWYAVESILLGSNNLLGTPPTDLFELRALKWLWLYSNPIQFKFDGIGNAKNLVSLLLDSTGLTSVVGVSNASSLLELDLRFNLLDGPIPDEIFELTNMESLSLSNNDISGSIPFESIATLTNLQKLRLGSNRLSGSLPDFSIHRFLNSLDLSNNRLTGSIPNNILYNTNVSELVFIDFSLNQLNGTIPGELSRFDKLSLYLKGNMFEDINPALCTKELWNDGDVGTFGCDGILCPNGTFSDIGRHSTLGNTCEDCPDNPFLGSVTCLSTSSSVRHFARLTTYTVSLLGFVMSVLII